MQTGPPGDGFFFSSAAFAFMPVFFTRDAKPDFATFTDFAAPDFEAFDFMAFLLAIAQ